MKAEGADDRYSEQETAQRRDEVIRRMIATPPQPRKPDKASQKRQPKKGRSKKG
jgi:hypothetical protein